jgi:hypothetical protein
MSKIKFNNFKTPYDEEQAFQRHLTYLRAKQRTSTEIQRSNLNNQLGINQVMPMPKTTSEILEDEQEVNKLVNNYLLELFVDNPNLVKKYNETDSQYENRKYPTRFVFSNLSQDDKQIFIQQYPAIKTELKGVAILTPSYFLNFIKKYKEAINRSGGVSSFSNSGIDEIKALLLDLPKKEDLEKLHNLFIDLQDETYNSDAELKDLFNRLNQKISNMRRNMPTFTNLTDLQEAINLKINDGSDDSRIDEVLQKIEQLPSRNDINQISLDVIDIIEQNPSMDDLKIMLEDILLNIGSNDENLINIQELLNNIRRKVNQTSNTLNDVSLKTNVKLKDGLVNKIYKEMMDDYVENYNKTSTSAKAITAKTLPKEVYAKLREDAETVALKISQESNDEYLFNVFNQEQKIPIAYQEMQYQEQPIGKEAKINVSEEGKGLANRIQNKIQPKFITRQKMIGKGLSLNETPKYIEFGKYCISIPHLNNEVLRVKYQKTMVDVPNFNKKISSDFVDFIETFIDTQKINDRQLEKLNKEEQQMFKKLIKKSGLDVIYKVKDYKDDNDKKEEDRFNLVKGQYIAGNDNPRVKDELRKFIIKFMMEGKINKKEGQDILFQLSM